MITTKRLQPCRKAFTIVESLFVLVVLTILTMVILALIIHEKEPAGTEDKASTGLSEPLPPVEDETE